MIALLALPVAIIVSLCWYLPIVKALGNNTALKMGDYLYIALVGGFGFTCIFIIITELAWDRAWATFMGSQVRSDLFANFMSDFFRAALLEELFKFLGFKLALNKYQPKRKIDYMLIAGLIGLVYGVVEKAVSGSIAGVLVGLAIPMHITWQLNQGGHYFEYERLKAAGNQESANKELMIALLGTFLFHGLWDFGLDLGLEMLSMEQMVISVLGGVLMLAMVVGGVIYCVRTVRKAIRIAKEAPSVESVAQHMAPQTPVKPE